MGARDPAAAEDPDVTALTVRLPHWYVGDRIYRPGEIVEVPTWYVEYWLIRLLRGRHPSTEVLPS